MDKIIRNVIIFALLILIVAIVFVIFTFSNNVNNSVASINSTSNNLGGSNIINGTINNQNTGEFQTVKLSVTGGTYVLTPSVLKKDIPVRMEADLNSLKGCSRDVVISAFNVRKYVKAGDNIITFTPTKTGIINIACSMNMYRGTFTVE
ncbi:MAG: hypothetical protein ACP5N1_01935 [Candidatus Woesearchaeota archaeon]